MTVLTRRTVLRATAASVVLVAPAGLAAAELPDALIALGASFAGAEAEFTRACRLLDVAESRLMLDRALPRIPSAVVGNQWHCMSPDEVMSHCQPLDPDGPDEETGLAIADDLAARRSEYEAARIDLGLGPLQNASDAARDRYHEVFRAVATTPAATLAGLAVKLRFVKRELDEGTTDYSDDLIDGAIADVERLAGGST